MALNFKLKHKHKIILFFQAEDASGVT